MNCTLFAYKWPRKIQSSTAVWWFRSLVGSMEISPPDRFKTLREKMKQKTMKRDTGPCGNFSAQYRCVCDLHNMPFLEEVGWVRHSTIYIHKVFLRQFYDTCFVCVQINYTQSSRHVMCVTNECLVTSLWQVIIIIITCCVVCWQDVDTISLALNNKFFMLAEFDHLDGK